MLHWFSKSWRNNVLNPRQIYNLFLSPDRVFVNEIRGISGFVPKELFLYHLAMTHSSLVRRNGQEGDAARECNERLEFLGDSILDSVVAEYLFKIYPTKDEGFLTEMRSKIVNRKSLNDICRKINLSNLVKHSQNGSINRSMYGDALEAFIGAVYLDLGYQKVKMFIHRRILDPHVQINAVEKQIISYKNKLIEYVQKKKLGILEFEVLDEIGEGPYKTFRVRSMVGDRVLGIGEGKNKKTAEQRASEDALIKLKVLPGVEPVA
jgi:ribonuclease-3